MYSDKKASNLYNLRRLLNVKCTKSYYDFTSSIKYWRIWIYLQTAIMSINGYNSFYANQFKK